MKMIMRMIMVMILDTFSVYFLIVFWSFEAWCGQVWPGLVLGALPGRIAALRRGVVGSGGENKTICSTRFSFVSLKMFLIKVPFLLTTPPPLFRTR